MVKEILWELTQEICASWKEILGIDKKPFFPLKIFTSNIYDI